jgi:hypothetical protein
MRIIHHVARKNLKADQQSQADDQPRKCLAYPGRDFVNGEEDLLHFLGP